MRIRQGLRVLTAVVAVSLAAVACGGADEAANDPPDDVDRPIESSTTTAPADLAEVRTGGELVVGLAAETSRYLPSTGSFAESGTQVAYVIFDPIAQRGADGSVHPFVAESIETNADATEWTVRLRDGITFHDGTALTAAVMLQIFEEYLTAESSVVSGDLAQVVELRVDDELTFTYVLDQPNAAFADLLVGPIGWPFSVEACRTAGEACGEQPVGTGPFRFVSWTRDSELVVERNPDYWRTDEAGNPLPYLDRIVFRPIPDQSSRLFSVRSGATDAGSSFVASDIRQAREADDLESREWTGSGGGVTLFNVIEPPLDDQRVRRALNMAASQDELIRLFGGEGIIPPKNQFYAPDSQWYSEDAAQAWDPYDPATAAELIEEYAQDPDRSDGKAPGAPVALTYQSPPDPALLDVAQYYQAVWREIGVEVELASVEQVVLINNVVGTADDQPPFSGDYQVSIFRAGGENDPATILSRTFGAPETQPANFTNYWSQELADELEVLQRAPDFAERYRASEAIMIELATQVPMMWRGALVSSIYTAPDVRNVAGWTIPGSDGSDDIPGAGVASAVTHWSHVWLDRG